MLVVFSVGTANEVFGIYDPNKVFTDATFFDYNSITLIDPESFTENGRPTIEGKHGNTIFNIGRLSMMDCFMLKYIYSCPNVQCVNGERKERFVPVNILPTYFHSIFIPSPAIIAPKATTNTAIGPRDVHHGTFADSETWFLNALRFNYILIRRFCTIGNLQISRESSTSLI